MKRWVVKRNKEVDEELKRLRKSGSLSDHDLELISDWVDEMEEFGPQYIRASLHWYDHALAGKWFGYRSSAFSSAGRIIYRVLQKDVVVNVVRITITDDYR